MKRWGLFLILFISTHSSAAIWEPSVRLQHRFGVAVGLFTLPYPSNFGLSVNYNFKRFLRVGVGYGSTSYHDSTLDVSLKTLSLDTVWFFIPAWSINPILIAGVSSVSGTHQGTGDVIHMAKFAGKTVPTYGIGVDCQLKSGWNAGFTIRNFLGSGAGNDTFQPGGYIGRYF